MVIFYFFVQSLFHWLNKYTEVQQCYQLCLLSCKWVPQIDDYCCLTLCETWSKRSVKKVIFSYAIYLVYPRLQHTMYLFYFKTRYGSVWLRTLQACLVQSHWKYYFLLQPKSSLVSEFGSQSLCVWYTHTYIYINVYNFCICIR